MPGDEPVQDPGPKTTEELIERLRQFKLSEWHVRAPDFVFPDDEGEPILIGGGQYRAIPNADDWNELLTIALELADRVDLCELALIEAQSTPFD